MKKNKLEKVAERLEERLQHAPHVKVKKTDGCVKALSDSIIIAAGCWVKEVVETAEEFNMNFYISRNLDNGCYYAAIHEF